MVSSSLFAALTLAGAAVSPTADWVDTVSQLLNENDTSSALEILDERTRSDPQDLAAWVWLADTYFLLAEEWAASGGSPELALIDAKAAYEEALKLAPLDARALRGAFRVCYELTQMEEALSYGLRDLSLTMMSGGEPEPWQLERVAQARALAFRADVPTDPAELAAAVRGTLALLRKTRDMAPGEPALARIEAEVLQEVGLFGASAKALESGLQKAPWSADLHQKLVDLTFRQSVVSHLVEFYEKLGAASPTDPTTAWYCGYAYLLQGDVLRRERRFVEAIDQYQKSISWLQRSSSLEPSYADGAQRIEVLAQSGIGWSHLRRGEFPKARDVFSRLLETAPDHRNLPDGMRRTYLDGLGSLGAEFETGLDFKNGVEIARRVLEYEPDSAYWWNNLAFFLREYGSQVEAEMVEVDGDPKEVARGIFQESWDSYLRASELAPTDARIVNDTALIQVYHLRTDLEKAEAMLNQSITEGERQLAELGPDASADDRYPIEQAVGDAYQNLGYLYYHLLEDLPRARGYFVTSMEIDPIGRQINREYIASIDGEAEPVPERDAAAALAALEPTRTERAQVAWERSFAGALQRAREENRPLMVYQVSGLTLLSLAYEDLVRRASFAELAEQAVCVVADKSRYNSIDRLQNGRRLPTPKYGTVTSSEHIAIQNDLNAWLQNQGGPSAGVPLAEGLYVFSPEGERLPVDLREGVAAFFEKAVEMVGEPSAAPDLEGLSRRLQGLDLRDRKRAAGELVASSQSRARDLVEDLVFDPAMSVSVRTALLDALAEQGSEADLELLRALVGQQERPDLSVLAAQRLPAGTDPQELRFAFHWSRDPEVRQAALDALLRVDASAETMRCLVGAMVVGELETRGIAAESARLEGENLEEALLAALGWEEESSVRAALCESLPATSELAITTLENLRDADGDPLVRAAARRALSGL